MRIADAVSSLASGYFSWRADWAWGVPLIVLTMLIHVLGLVLINERFVRLSSRVLRWSQPTAVFVVVMGCTTLLVSFLHGIELAIWAATYRLLGAFSDTRSAVLYSLNAITSYGHTSLTLEARWELMGALEALNGWLLFGLTTAFLFAMIDKVSLNNRLERR